VNEERMTGTFTEREPKYKGLTEETLKNGA
jgi:hypothetical protein